MVGKVAVLRFVLDNAVAVYLCAFGHEDIVQQYAFLHRQTAEVMERPGRTVGDGSCLCGIFHSSLFQRLQRFFTGRTVKVTGDDGGHVRCYLLDFVENELHALFAGCLSVVVQMGVEIYKLLSVVLFLQYRPGGDTVVGSVLALDADSFGLLAEGEIAVFHQCKPVGPEEYRAVFACFLAVVAPHTECCVLRQPAF